jgi:uncharacterized cofD-like protein
MFAGTRIAALGGGHGLAAVLRALSNDDVKLDVIVTIADDGGSSGELRRRREGPAVGDLRRSLLALTGEEVALAHAFARPVSINRLGRHPLGNLVIRSVAEGFGDLSEATQWLGEQLGIAGRVLPATDESVSLIADAGDVILHGESAIGAATQQIGHLRFKPRRPAVPAAVLEAIARADWVLLAPGSLYTSMLAASAVPDVAAALRCTTARIIWIPNLEPDERETARMSARDHLAALRRHGVRADACLYDPRAELRFTAPQLQRRGLLACPYPLLSGRRGVHDPELLRAALREMFSDLDRAANPHRSPVERSPAERRVRNATH